MQILEAAVKAVGSLDDDTLAQHIRSTTFDTVVGPIKFGARGEWEQPRILLVQYRGVEGGDVERFKRLARPSSCIRRNSSPAICKYRSLLRNAALRAADVMCPQ